MQRRLICVCAGALLSATAGSAGAATDEVRLQVKGAFAATGGAQLALGMTPEQKTAAGYAKVDNTLAAIAEQVSATPRVQLPGRLLDSAASVRFTREDPLLVPNVLVDIQVKGEPAALEQRLQQLGAQHLSRFSNLISAFLPVDRIKDAAALDGLRFMRTSRAVAHTGSITSQGDFVQHSDLVRASTAVPGLTGAGITVGVMSDSFACTSAVKSYADDVASGDLPKDVQVLEEYNALPSGGTSQCQGATDEGRAMAQIVYDVAPGTKLKFYTAFNGEADFANGILALAGAGANVITDDVGYFDEPVFQDGILSQAIDQVKSKGVAHFSSAGNSARQSYEADYKDSGTVGATGADNAGEKLVAFTSLDGTKTQNFLPFTVPTGFTESMFPILEWDQPYVTGAPGSPGAASSLDLCLTDATGKLIPKSCSGFNPLKSDPVVITQLNTDGTTAAYGLQIGLVSGTAPHHLKIIFQDDGGGTLVDPAFATSSPTIQGHPGAAGAAAVGASYFRANPVCLPAVYPAYTLESYSSAGGDPILFDKTGTSQTPVIRQKPDFVAPDGGNTTFFAQKLGARSSSVPQCQNAAGTWNFFGTSAAAPHAAGVAALLMQAVPAATPDLIFKTLGDTAILGMATKAGGPVEAAVNFDTGHGFIQADAALAKIVPRVLSLSSKAISFGDQRVGATSTMQSVTLTNGGGFPTRISAITGSGDFTVTNNCPMAPATLASKASCMVQVAAAPTTTGARSGSVSIGSDAASSPDSVSLSANGVQSKALLTPKSLDFGSVTQGGSTKSPFTSGTKMVSLVNVGSAPLNITTIAAGDASFVQSNNCPAALAVGASCSISVDFSPAAAQPYSSQLSLTSDGAPSGDSQVALTGTGTAPANGGAFAPWLLLPGFAVFLLRRRKRV